MIYNLVAYLKIKFPAETIYTNNRVKIFPAESVPDRNILVSETGGLAQPWFGLTRQNIQILTRDIDAPKARQLAIDIKQEIHDRYGLSLPAVTIDGTLFPAFDISQILEVSEPQSLGPDANGRFEFSSNYVLTTRINTRG